MDEKIAALKEKGNNQFREKLYDDCIDTYSEAIHELAMKRQERQNLLSDVGVVNVDKKELNNTDEADIDVENEKCPYTDEEKEILAALFGNRSAAYLAIHESEAAIDDCNQALDYKPDYIKVLIRRMQIHEKADRLDDALIDAKKVLSLDPSYPSIQSIVNKLQIKHDEKMNKLKDEALSKLKDLGNTILGNFGMSLDNFKMKQDPNTGSWSINMNQG